MRRLFLLALLAGVLRVDAQDVLTIGSGGDSVPVSIRDNNGASIRNIAFKVLYSTDSVASITFTRGGVLASLTPLYERAMNGDGWTAYVVAFGSSIPFAPNADSVIGTLNVAFKPGAVVGTTIALRFDAPSAMLLNETIALGNLSLVNGSVTVLRAAPTGLVATADAATHVGLTWNAVAGATQYEVWRSVDGIGFGFLANSGVTSYSDGSVVAGKTYLYQVRASDGAFSATDAATTILFSEDVYVRALHFTQLRDAVNAFRVSASLAPLSSDPTVAVGALIRASHLTDLRTALDQARAAVGMSALSYTDATPVIIKSVHVTELRDGVQ
ncbi:MAG TPA: hypothetical protein VJZ00_24620 [Thermoanaerobaculia bacterium]|nr:hypothetical protein [Thermoanaerobaculia bacterium]